MQIIVKHRTVVCEFCDPISRSIHSITIEVPDRIKNIDRYASAYIQREHSGVLIRHEEPMRSMRTYNIAQDDFTTLIEVGKIKEVNNVKDTRANNEG